jgi:hypothetical protein
MDKLVTDSRVIANNFAGSQLGLRQARSGHKALPNYEAVSEVPSDENNPITPSSGVKP